MRPRLTLSMNEQKTFLCSTHTKVLMFLDRLFLFVNFSFTGFSIDAFTFLIVNKNRNKRQNISISFRLNYSSIQSHLLLFCLQSPIPFLSEIFVEEKPKVFRHLFLPDNKPEMFKNSVYKKTVLL